LPFGKFTTAEETFRSALSLLAVVEEEEEEEEEEYAATGVKAGSVTGSALRATPDSHPSSSS